VASIANLQAGLAWRRAVVATRRRFAAGRLLLCAGEPATTIYLLEKGLVRVYLLSQDGRETTTGILGAGQLVGISPLLGRSTYRAFAEAINPVEAWAMASERLVKVVPEDRELLGLVIGALTQRLEQGVALLGDLALFSVAERVHEIEARLTHQPQAPRLTNRALAELIGTRPETLSRALHRGLTTATTYGSDENTARPNAAAVRQRQWPARRQRSIHPVDELIAPLVERSYPAGARVRPPASGAQSVYVVRSGTVRLFLEDRLGREVGVDLVERGECFGLPPLVTTGTHMLLAETLTSASIAEIEPAALSQLLDSNPRFARDLVAQFGGQLERVEQRLHRAHASNACARLASLLEEFADRAGEPQPDGRMLLPAGWTHVALGRELGLRRETVSRALRTLARDGRVDQRGHRLAVGRLRPGRPQPRPREQIVERAGDQNC
jgi:CRP/FNR family transcriptional regulator, cyclic AMP receptor protein